MPGMEATEGVAETGKRPRYNRLDSLEDVRRNLARALRAVERVNRERRGRPGRTPPKQPTMEQEKLELERCRCLVTGYRALAEMFSGVEMEKRLRALEERQAKGAH